MGLRGGAVGFLGRRFVLGQGGVKVRGLGDVWGLRGLVRVCFGLGWEGFWVQAWGFWVCDFGVWGGTGWVCEVGCWVFGGGGLCEGMGVMFKGLGGCLGLVGTRAGRFWAWVGRVLG